MTNPWNNSHRFFYLMSIEMVTFFSFLNKSLKRLLILLPLIVGLIIAGIMNKAIAELIYLFINIANDVNDIKNKK